MDTPSEDRGVEKMPRAGLLIALVAVIGFVAWFGWERDEELAGKPGAGGTGEDPSENNYVGSRACAECHQQIAADYSRHPMARTLQPVGTAELIEDFDADRQRFVGGQRTYQIERRDGEVFHHEVMFDDDGGVLYDQAETVQFAIGAGVKGRSYLLQRKELLFESPITWYSQTSSWGLSPGYPPDLHYRFGRRVGGDCLACHSGRPAVASAGSVDRYVAENPFHEISIGCERCHGPGGQHVDLYSSSSSVNAVDPLIVSSGKLAGHLQDDICNQCHLEGKIRVLRPGKRFDDFRPGEPLGKTWTVYVAESPFDGEGRPLFTSHVEQMHASRCFQGSEGGMRCTTCHDPHRAPTVDERASFYKSRCNSCHDKRGCSLPTAEQQKAPAAGSCIACHMPKLHSRDVAHTTQADHRVVRRMSQTRAVRDVERESVGGDWQPFGTMDQHLSDGERRRADALAWFRQAADAGDRELATRARKRFEQILADDPDDTEIRGRLGFAWFRARNLAAAKKELERALRSRPDSEPYLTYLGLIGYATDDASAARHFRRLLELNPNDGEAHGPYADMLESAGKLDEAIRMAERGLARDPTVLDLRRSLARFLHKAGRAADAREQERKVEQIGRRLRRR